MQPCFENAFCWLQIKIKGDITMNKKNLLGATGVGGGGGGCPTNSLIFQILD